jgi:hypothetical protein
LVVSPEPFNPASQGLVLNVPELTLLPPSPELDMLASFNLLAFAIKVYKYPEICVYEKK